MASPIDRGRPRLRGAAALLGYGGYLGLLGLAVVGSWVAAHFGANPSAVVLVALPTMALVCWGLEYVQPYTLRWRPKPASFRLDLLHTVLSGAAIAPFVRAGALALVVALGAELHDSGGPTPWPDELPMGLQAALAVVIADFGAYCAHRFMHVSRVGWRMHVIHHSPKALHFLASARTHPFNVVLTLGCESIAVLSLGINPTALMLATVVKGVNGLLQHSNIDLRPGWLSGVLATNEAHWWHHSVELDESNRNFGNSTMVWDRLLGTWFMPSDRPPRVEVGVADALIPENYLWHMAAPFVLTRFEQAAASQAEDVLSAEAGVRQTERAAP